MVSCITIDYSTKGDEGVSVVDYLKVAKVFVSYKGFTILSTSESYRLQLTVQDLKTPNEWEIEILNPSV